MNKHKIFIKECYEGKHGTMCQEWKDTILEHYPEFKEEFKVGDYVIETLSRGQFARITGFEDSKTFELELLDGNEDVDYIKDYRKATPKEIEQHLIQEAKKRGLWGVPIKAINGEVYGKVFKVDYEYDDDCLWSEYGRVYRRGKWAEIIPTMTKEEAEKKLNCKIV